MNRSTIGDYLKEAGLEKHAYNYGVRKNTYHVYSTPTGNECVLITKYCTIQGVDDIYLCTNEIMIIGKFDEMRINIPYNCLDDLEVRVIPYE